MSLTKVAATPIRIPWLLILTPFIAYVYYTAILIAFVSAKSHFVEETNDLEQAGIFVYWGQHWVLRSFAEMIAISIATFVCGGISRERSKEAASISGLTISALYIFKVIVLYHLSQKYGRSYEPTAQFIIDLAIIPIAPFVSSKIGRLVYPELIEYNGFLGVNRWHFLWLWFAFSFYGSFVFPLIYDIRNMSHSDNLFYGRLLDVINLIYYTAPLLFYVVPLGFGLSVLAGQKRYGDVIGSAIIVLGFPIAMGAHFAWIELFHWLGY